MKKALILTWDRFQDHEVIYPYYSLKEHGFEVTVAATEVGARIYGDLGAHIVSDIHVDMLEYTVPTNSGGSPTSRGRIEDYDLLVIPGGVKALEKLRLNKMAVRFVQDWFAADKITFCVCNGAQLLITADVLKGRKCSGYYSIEPDIKNAGAEYSRNVTVDGNLVSCAHYNDMGEWMKKGYEVYESKVKAVGQRANSFPEF